MSTTAERSPSYNPWEQRAHIRASAVTACVGGRWVVAASAHPRSGDGGLGVALAKAVLAHGNGCSTASSMTSTNESGGRAAQTADPQADNLRGGVSDG